MTDLEQAAQKVVRQLRADPGWAPHQLALVLRRATVILELEPRPRPSNRIAAFT